MRGGLLVLGGLVALGCFSPDLTTCADGSLCPVGLVCDPAHALCVSQQQIDQCQGRANSESCAFQGSSGFCAEGVCLAAVCGDGIEVGLELCDDGNTVGRDGCSANCLSDERCGNGVVDAFLGEACDCGDGAGELPDGCLLPNSDAPEASCRSDCTAQCGDGEVDIFEDCDGFDPTVACTDFGYGRGPVECSAQCGFETAACASLGWTPIYIGQAGQLNGSWSVGDEIFTAGNFLGGAGVLGHFNGTKWSYYDVPQTMTAIWGRSPTEVYAVGRGGAIYRWDGSSWSKEDAELPAKQNMILDVWGDDSLTLIAVISVDLNLRGGIFRRQTDGSWVRDWDDDLGISAFALGGDEVTGPIASVRSSSAIGGTKFMVQRLPTGEWDILGAVLSGPSPEAIAVADGVAFAGDTSGAVLRYSADDDEWQEIGNVGHRVFGMEAMSPTDVYVTGFTPSTLVGTTQHWDGVALEVIRTGAGFNVDKHVGKIRVAGPFSLEEWAGDGEGPKERILEHPYLADIDTIWTLDRSFSVVAAAGRAAVWEGTDTTQYVVGLGAIRTVWGRSSTEVYLSGGGPGSAATILKFDGNSWAAMDPLPPSFPLSVAALHGDADRLVAGGHDGWVYEYYGGSWIDRSLPSPATVTDVWTGSGQIFVTADGDLWRFANDAWTLVLPSGKLTSLWGSSVSDVQAVGKDGEIWHFDGSASERIPSPTQQDILTVRGSSAEDLFAVAADGRTFHFDGRRWAPLALETPSNGALAVSPTDVLVGNAFGIATRLVRTQSWVNPAL